MADRYPYHAEAVGARDNRSGARGSESDPLAELARLIGQTDPNAMPGRCARAQRAPQRSQHHDREQYRGSALRAGASTSPCRHPDAQQPHAGSSRAASQHALRRSSRTHRSRTSRPATHHAAAEQAHYQQAQQEYSDTPAFLRTRASARSDALRRRALRPEFAERQPQYADGQYPATTAIRIRPIRTTVIVYADAVAGGAAPQARRPDDGRCRAGARGGRHRRRLRLSLVHRIGPQRRAAGHQG